MSPRNPDNYQFGPDASQQPDPHQRGIEARAEKAIARDKLRELVERGVVVDGRGRRGQPRTMSDLDGNTAVALLKAAGYITEETPVYYVDHEEIGDFLKEHPEVGVMIDISPEEIEGAHEHQYADSLIGSITTYGGRLYFDHHGPTSLGGAAGAHAHRVGDIAHSGSSTRKLYEWLLATQPNRPSINSPYRHLDRTGPKGWDNIVAFVDANDERTYYLPDIVDPINPQHIIPAPFDLETTAYNAFGLMNQEFSVAGGKIGRYDTGQHGYHPAFIELMRLTGNNPTRKLTLTQLRQVFYGSTGADAPAESEQTAAIKSLIERTKQEMRGMLTIVKKLRENGAIVKAEHRDNLGRVLDTSEILVDTRNGSQQDLWQRYGVLHLDKGDALQSVGVTTRLIYGVGENGQRTITVFSQDSRVLEKLRTVATTIGGKVARNMYVYNENILQQAGWGVSPTLETILLELGVGQDDAKRLSQEQAIAQIQPTLPQTNEKSCVAAALANLRKFTFGYQNIHGDQDILREARDLGIQGEGGVKTKDIKRFYEKLGHTVFNRGSVEDILAELMDGKGLVVFARGHVVAIHLDKETMQLTRRDPVDGGKVATANGLDAETLKKWLGINRLTNREGEPYGHVLIVGKVGAEPVTGGKSEMGAEAVAQAAMESNYTEKTESEMTMRERLAWVWKTYRPHLELPNTPTIRHHLTNRTFWGRLGNTTVDLSSDKQRGAFQALYNSQLDLAFEWELRQLESGVAQIDEIEQRYIAEAIINGEQIAAVRAAEVEYKKVLGAQITDAENHLKNHTYTHEDQRAIERQIKNLTAQRDLIEKGTPYRSPITGIRVGNGYGKKRLGYMAQPSELWTSLAELKIEYYRWAPVAELQHDISREQVVVGYRGRFIQTSAELKRLAEVLDEPEYRPALRALKRHINAYQQTSKQLGDMVSLASGLSTEPNEEILIELSRDFVQLRTQEAVEFYAVLAEIAVLKSVPEYQQDQAITGLEMRDEHGNHIVGPDGKNKLWVPDINEPDDAKRLNDLMQLANRYESLKPGLRHRMLEAVMARAAEGDLLCQNLLRSIHDAASQMNHDPSYWARYFAQFGKNISRTERFSILRYVQYRLWREAQNNPSGGTGQRQIRPS